MKFNELQSTWTPRYAPSEIGFLSKRRERLKSRTRYVSGKAFRGAAKRLFGVAVKGPRVVKVVTSDEDGLPVCAVCIAVRDGVRNGQRSTKRGDECCDGCADIRPCATCGICAHETCGGAYQGSSPPLCEACGRSESDSDCSQAVQIGNASTTTEENEEEESLGSLRDLIVSDSDLSTFEGDLGSYEGGCF